MVVGSMLHINGNPTVHFSCKSNHDRPSYIPKPTAVKMTTITTTTITTAPSILQPYWASLQADIEAHLKHVMPYKDPLVVFEPMHHLVFSAPRTTVPALCLAAGELLSGDRHQAMAAASALVLLLAANHTHEQIPSKPKSKPKPMSRPKSNTMSFRAFSPGIELMTGDGLIPFGFELLSKSCDSVQENSDRVLRVIIEISRAVGSKGLIDAQYKKFLLSESDGGESCHVERIMDIMEKNEGGLHACGASCGAMLGGGSEEEIERLRKFGFYVGMIQGMVNEGFWEEVEVVKDLAFKELQYFKDNNRDVDAISSFIIHV
ncbi:heterodimeric geranylgeranyl pyrophosphate synthase small subunit, chloroplastic-like [Arachis stenosperma]|uniref:heterodimeric geranylgeranyl pyrophosphate synthase small subunit, chloroplastic-like n=1 Tax=Arachis stenosperma TaxID=217475 RepID=UPI0025ACB3C8|nr:heterodimeric geranylgeranyl pyrophosphate synthase small subunit, chloroplastic-like [Arachis stenosperma]